MPQSLGLIRNLNTESLCVLDDECRRVFNIMLKKRFKTRMKYEPIKNKLKNREGAHPSGADFFRYTTDIRF